MVEGGVQRKVVAATNSIMEAEAIASARIAPVKLEQLDRKTQFGWRSTAIELGTVAIMVQEYGAAFSLSAAEGAPDQVVASFPLSAVAAEASVSGVAMPIARGRSTYLYSPPGKGSFRCDTKYRGLHATFGLRDVSTTLAALLGATLDAPLRFEPCLSLERGVGPALHRALKFVAVESATDDGLFAVPLAAQRFGEALIVNLLQGQRHNFSERLAKITRSASSRSVRLAADYLAANLGRSVRVAELASVVGVSARALQIGFQKYRGCSPAEFLRDRRLDLARACLLAAGPRTSIAEVARQAGFTHLGRFSARYRTRFGELPIQTRARAR